MDVNNTVAVDIMVKAAMQGASTSFNAGLNAMQKDAQRVASQIQDTLNTKLGTAFFTKLGKNAASAFNAGLAGIKLPDIPDLDATGSPRQPRSGAGGGSDPYALKNFLKYDRDRRKIDADYSAFVDSQAEKQYRAKQKQWLKSAEQFQRILNENKKAEEKSSFGNTAVGSFLGNFAADAVARLIQGIVQLISYIKDLGLEAIKAGARFEKIVKSLEVFTGSTRLARQELAAIDKTARETAGLRLETAEAGYQQLRALGFQANLARGFVKELGEEKILSGAADEALERVIFNFAQIASGGQKVSQELREIVTAMPTLQKAFFDAFQTLDPQKIQEFFDKDTDAAFQRLLDAMARGKAAAGGLDDATGKLSDEWLRAGRIFAEPILEPATKLIQDLSKDVDGNGSTFRLWGENVANVIKGLSALTQSKFVTMISYIVDFSDRLSTLLLTFGASGGSTAQGFGDRLGYALESARSLTTFQQTGVFIDFVQMRKERQELNAFKKDYKEFKDETFNNQNFTVNFDAFNKETAEERQARLLAQEKTLQLKIEKSRQAALEQLKETKKQELQIVDGNYNILEARARSYVTYTAEQELAQTRRVNEIRQAGIKKQIGVTNAYYTDLAKFGNLSAEEATKANAEKNSELITLNNQLILAQINGQKELAEQEKRIFEQRRQNIIEFKNSQIKAIEQGLSLTTASIERSLTSQSGDYQKHYSDLVSTTNAAYIELIRLTSERNALALSNQSLSEQERVNLYRESFTELEKLSAENSQRVTDIEERRFAQSRKNLEDYLNFLNQQNRAQSDRLADFSKIFTPEVFGQLGEGGVGNLLLTGVSDEAIASYNKYSEALKNGSAETANLEDRTIQLLQGTPLINIQLAEMASSFSSVTGAINSLDKAQELIIRGRFRLAIAEAQRDVEKADDAFVQLQQTAERNRETNINEIQAQLDRLKVDRSNLLGDSSLTDGVRKPLLDDVENRAKSLQLRLDEAKASQAIVDTGAQQNVEASKALALGNLRNLQLQQALDLLEVQANSLENLTSLRDKLAAADAVQLRVIEEAAQKSQLKQEIADYTEIYKLKYDLANSPYINSLAIEKALLQDLTEVRNSETEAIIAANRAQLQLAAQTTYSANEANAKVLEFLASQKSVTDTVADFKISLISSGYDYIDKTLDRVLSKLGAVGSALKDMLSSFIKMALNSAFRRLFGLDGGVMNSGGAGGGGFAQIANTILGGGSFGGGGSNAQSGAGGGFSGATLNPFSFGNGNPFQSGLSGASGSNPFYNNPLFGGDGLSGSPTEIAAGAGGSAAGGAVNTATRAGGLFGGKLGGIIGSPVFGGALLGASLGVGLGGQSKIGQILGGVGGLALGAVGTAVGASLLGSTAGVSSGLIAATGALSALGFATLGAGLALGVAAYLFGRAKRRRIEKENVTKLSGDALAQIQQLVADVKAYKIDGSSAYTQGISIRDNFSEQIKQLKTSPGKKLAQQKLVEINRLLDTLKAEGTLADNQRKIAADLDTRLLPTFDVGGFTGFSAGAGVIQVHGIEAVLNQQNIMALGGYRALQQAGVRGISKTGASDRPNVPSGGGGYGGGVGDVYVIATYDEESANQLYDKVSPLGAARKVRMASKGGDDDGLFELFKKKLIKGD